jgi:uncharacterized protein (DUF1499 family)
MTRLGGVSLWVAGFGLLTAVAAALSHRSRLLPFGPAFLMFGVGLLAALIAMALSVSALVMALMRTPRPESAVTRPAIALGLSVTLLAVPVSRLLSNRGAVPAIHDITTDPHDPPAYVDVLPRRATAPNPVSYGGPDVAAQQRRAYPDIAPLTLPAPRDQVFDRVLEVVRDLGWELVAANRQEGRIEATDRTFWFGFEDDVVIRLRDTGGGTRVDVRSLSRVGGGDVGTNAKRIRRFCERLRSVG